jgi:hypothetical protein
MFSHDLPMKMMVQLGSHRRGSPISTQVLLSSFRAGSKPASPEVGASQPDSTGSLVYLFSAPAPRQDDQHASSKARERGKEVGKEGSSLVPGLRREGLTWPGVEIQRTATLAGRAALAGATSFSRGTRNNTRELQQERPHGGSAENCQIPLPLYSVCAATALHLRHARVLRIPGPVRQ